MESVVILDFMLQAVVEGYLDPHPTHTACSGRVRSGAEPTEVLNRAATSTLHQKRSDATVKSHNEGRAASISGDASTAGVQLLCEQPIACQRTSCALLVTPCHAL